MRGIDCAHFKRFPDPESIKNWSSFQYTLRFPEPGKRFQASVMRAIDSLHKITPRESIFHEKSKFFDFCFNKHNQGQESVFKLRE